MADISINLGDAFLLNTPPNGEHLYIAIAKTSSTKYLFVNVTSRKANSEPTCILIPGEGVPSFLKRESVIAYQFARELDSRELAKLITVGSQVPKDTCSVTVLAKIQQGGLTSKRLKNQYKTALRAFLGLP
jgi:hypothetical protein